MHCKAWAQVGAAENIGECLARDGAAGDANGAGTVEAGTDEVASAAKRVRDVSYVKLGDVHLDAKLFPHLHPYGAGSLRSEEGSGGLKRYAKSRLCALDNGFRHSSAWQFFNLDRLIKNDLFFKIRGPRPRPSGAGGKEDGPEPKKQARGTKRNRDVMEADDRTADEKDEMVKRIPQYLFGHAEPSHVPESRSWWEKQRRDLYAISEDHENGLMTGMVTLTQNDRSPELLAHVRRGPCAKPTAEEQLEYLLGRKIKPRAPVCRSVFEPKPSR